MASCFVHSNQLVLMLLWNGWYELWRTLIQHARAFTVQAHTLLYTMNGVSNALHFSVNNVWKNPFCRAVLG